MSTHDFSSERLFAYCQPGMQSGARARRRLDSRDKRHVILHITPSAWDRLHGSYKYEGALFEKLGFLIEELGHQELHRCWHLEFLEKDNDNWARHRRARDQFIAYHYGVADKSCSAEGSSIKRSPLIRTGWSQDCDAFAFSKSGSGRAPHIRQASFAIQPASEDFNGKWQVNPI